MKKAISLFLAIFLICSFSFSAFAQSSEEEELWRYIPFEEQVAILMEEYCSTPRTEAEKQAYLAKLYEKHNLIEQIENRASTRAYDGITSTVYLQYFPHYVQGYSNSCGAATIKQTVKYLTGVECDEWELYKDATNQDNPTGYIGTAGFLRVLNKTLTNNGHSLNFQQKRITSNTNMCALIWNAVAVFKSPAVLLVEMKKSNGWYTDADGHYLNAAGISTGGEEIYCVDPGRNEVSGYGKIWRTDEQIYSSVMNNSAKCIFM